jgi:alkylation response protein AidB-like acyl-CoA dehydrogenase
VSVRELLRTTARRFLDAKVPLASVAAQADASSQRLDRELWSQLCDMGWTSIALPPAAEGLGLAEQLILFEELGRALAPLPYFTSVALAAACFETNQAACTRLVEGSSTFTLAWAEPAGPQTLADLGQVSCRAMPGARGWELTGRKTRVPDAGLATEAVVVARSEAGVGLYLADLSSERVDLEPMHVFDGTRREYTIELRATPAECIASPEETAVILPRVRTRALCCLAYEALGVADRVLQDSVEYASQRQQFGRPIGAFQAVAGPLADRYVEIELARALAEWALRAIEEGDPAANLAAAAAKATCAEAAVRTVETAIQTSGAIGFTWEYHLHRFLRRGLWIARCEGGAASQRAIVAATILDRREAPRVVELMDSDDAACFRRSVCAWIDERLPTAERGLALITPVDVYDETRRRWQAEMAETGLLVAHWPEQLGGKGTADLFTAIFREEAIRAHPRVSHGDGGVDLVAPLLMTYGTSEQRARFLDPIRCETEIWAQGFSEPDAGSDLAGLKTRAVSEGDAWILNGTKTWTTYSPVADWLFVLARTDPKATRHRGISCFIVDAKAEGVEIRPIRDIAGTFEFGEVFLTDVRVPAANVLGAINEGWGVAVMTLAHERVIESCEDIGELGFMMDRLVDCVRELPGTGVAPADDPLVRDELARLWCQLQAVRLVQHRCLTALEGSDTPPSESEIIKLAWSEVAQRVARLGVDRFATSDGSRFAETVADYWERCYLNARSLTIYAGTSEILRSVVAERVLGLPRSR